MFEKTIPLPQEDTFHAGAMHIFFLLIHSHGKEN
jgi:hypothetical protein